MTPQFRRCKVPIETVEEDGAKFMLVHWGYDVGSNPWYKPIPADAKLPDSFDPHYASNQFPASVGSPIPGQPDTVCCAEV